MNLLSGLEKFGLKAEDTTNLFAEEKKEVVGEDGTKQEAAPTEESFLLDKAVRCAVCDKVFKTKMIKSGRLKRLESDMDLRPRYEHIDTLKYSVISCPYCGYTAITRYFEHLSSMQVKMIKEKICVNFKPADNVEPTLIDYDTAIRAIQAGTVQHDCEKRKEQREGVHLSESCMAAARQARVFRRERSEDGRADQGVQGAGRGVLCTGV